MNKLNRDVKPWLTIKWVLNDSHVTDSLGCNRESGPPANDRMPSWPQHSALLHQKTPVYDCYYVFTESLFPENPAKAFLWQLKGGRTLAFFKMFFLFVPQVKSLSLKKGGQVLFILFFPITFTMDLLLNLLSVLSLALNVLLCLNHSQGSRRLHKILKKKNIKKNPAFLIPSCGGGKWEALKPAFIFSPVATTN